MAVTNTQQGVITEAEFAKVVMLTSGGRLVPARPLADDDRRDFEIHIRRHFLESLAVQLKTSKVLRPHGHSRLLQINFRMAAPIVTDKRLWYFLAHFDVKAMRFTDPVFLVPSGFFHKHAIPELGAARSRCNSRPAWSRVRVTCGHNGRCPRPSLEAEFLRSSRTLPGQRPVVNEPQISFHFPALSGLASRVSP